MEASALESNDIDTIPPQLTGIYACLIREGIYLGQEAMEVKNPQRFEDRAVRAVNEAMRLASELYRITLDVDHGARLLEKIQVATADAERAAYLIRSPVAKKCREMAHQIAVQSREFLHELKDRNTALRQRIV